MPKSLHMSAAALAMRKASFSSGGDCRSSHPLFPVGLEPIAVVIAAEAIFDQQLFGGIRIEVPPAVPKTSPRRSRHFVALLFGPGGNLVGYGRIVGLIHLARFDLDLQVL